MHATLVSAAPDEATLLAPPVGARSGGYRWPVLVIGRIDPERSLGLRRDVLRPHQRLDEIAADDAPGSITFGATEDGTVISTATIIPSPPPVPVEGCTGTPFRLRGVATQAGRRGEGIGHDVLCAILADIGDDAALWCYARLGAERFYAREGFVRVGEEFVVDPIGPHVLMVRPAGTG